MEGLGYLSYPASIISDWTKTLADSPLDDDQKSLLLIGRAWVHDLQNAYQGHARAVCALTAKGLMRFDNWHDGVWSHRLTPKGEQLRKEIQRSRFPEMGIREIPPEQP